MTVIGVLIVTITAMANYSDDNENDQVSNDNETSHDNNTNNTILNENNTVEVITIIVVSTSTEAMQRRTVMILSIRRDKSEMCNKDLAAMVLWYHFLISMLL